VGRGEYLSRWRRLSGDVNAVHGLWTFHTGFKIANTLSVRFAPMASVITTCVLRVVPKHHPLDSIFTGPPD
jgi:hypothetical protein